MSDFEHFLELRKKYFTKTASPAEEAEYIELFKSGKFAQQDQDVHEQIWNSPKPLSEEDRRTGEEIYSTLISKQVSRSRVRRLQSRALWLTAAASIVLFLSIGLWQYQKGSKEGSHSFPQDLLLTINGPAFVKLPDTSIVELRAGSTLTYNKKTFGINDRRIGLKGTAFFDVSHNKSLPFQVHSGKVITTVLGTAFNVMDSAGVIEVTVVRGKVNVGDKTTTFETITPNEKITVLTKSMTYAKATVNTANEVAWKDRNLILDDLTMEQAILFIEQRFHVSIILENEDLKYCPVTAYFVNNESLDQIMDVLCKLRRATHVMHDGKILIQNGEGCNKP